MSFFTRHPKELLKTPEGYIQPASITAILPISDTAILVEMTGYSISIRLKDSSERDAWISRLADAQRSAVQFDTQDVQRLRALLAEVLPWIEETCADPDLIPTAEGALEELQTLRDRVRVELA